MFYPFKFNPVYKDYLWGGRNLEKIGKTLPAGKIAESWEIASHPDGMSIIANGEFEGMSLFEVVRKYGKEIIGTALPKDEALKFPLLVKLIDANDKLSVQVHPDDRYARIHENGEWGKSEAWYIISATPGAKLIYDVLPGINKDSFTQAVKERKVESCLKQIEVEPGDVINIPAGLIHAIGEGIVLAEIQQNSNATYRLYDYDRIDKNGNKRPLHIEKAIDVIDFNAEERNEKVKGLDVKIGPASSISYKVANRYFTLQLYDVDGRVDEIADGSRFYIFVFIEGEGELHYNAGILKIGRGESVLIPAALGIYTLYGKFKAIKSYVPDINQNVILPLKEAGYSEEEIFNNVKGLTS